MHQVRSFIGGNWLDNDGEVFERMNPGDLGESIGRICLADKQGAEHAVETAQRAFKSWSSKPLKERAELLHGCLDVIAEEKERLARIIVSENGKTLNEARGEVEGGLSDARYLLQVAERESMIEHPSLVKSGLMGEVRHRPLGTFLLITPWNFPFATVMRKLFPALVYGNTVVCKPSLQTPFSAGFIFEKLQACGLDDGVANLVIGKSSATGDALVQHPLVRGISFTGSTEVGHHICELTSKNDVRLQLEMGGKNAQIVLNDANLELAADAAVTAGFSCAGQWCTSTSRVLIAGEVYDEFVGLLISRVKNLKVGPGVLPETSMGAITSQSQYQEILKSIEKGMSEGAELLTGGGPLPESDGYNGQFIKPTVFGRVIKGMTLFEEEIFGPVLSLTVFQDVEEAIRLTNLSPYGLSFSVFTRSPEDAEQIIQEVDAGIGHVNLHTAVRDPAYPVTGWKQSGRGTPECGSYGREFYTHVKAVYYPKISE